MAAVQTNFIQPNGADGFLTISLTPPTNISGWSIQTDLLQNFGGLPIYSSYLASGFNGMSGTTILDGVNGVYQVYFPEAVMSGMNAGNYPFESYRTSGGLSMTPLAFGFRLASLG